MARFLATLLIATIISFGLVTFSNAETQIYDANGQYIGIFVPLKYGNIYIPSLDLITGFIEEGENKGDIMEIPTSLYYDQVDCGGENIYTPIVLWLSPPNRLFRDPCEEGLWVTGQVEEFDKYSYRANESYLEDPYRCQCTNYGYMQTDWMTKLVPFDETTLPFTLPVAMPLQMVYTKPVIPGRPPDKGPPNR